MTYSYYSEFNKEDQQLGNLAHFRGRKVFPVLTLGSNDALFFLSNSSTLSLISGVILLASKLQISSLMPLVDRKLKESKNFDNNMLDATENFQQNIIGTDDGS